ncbi:ABC transporter ATP-binding protein/permease [Corynebacterium pseudotuberculosis]|uniref:ABC transporter ATP-binding protein/permease n=1 Tax=Corynebacterium pseudotuberculosis TaxID=1719 RepID=UPI0008F7F84B|nr:ATP-binding cassette domain-containing protein [Corynebacterium pseudotuberculosis]APB19696.1 ABC transporter permease [Corynebacterium pseudotuberculosis]APB21738.1 ABC transporter permease [Corynebacterium pseudotuberculosis]
MNGPINIDLVRITPATQKFLVGAGVAEGLRSCLVLARGFLIGTLVARTITAFSNNAAPHISFWYWLSTLLVMVALALITGAARHWAHVSCGNAIDQLRSQALTALRRKDPREVQEEAGHWRALLGEGLGSLRGYFSDYLPALLAMCIATPSAILVISFLDLPSGLLAAGTIPLIPLFMVLIGTLTRTATQRRLQETGTLNGQLVDLLSGALTLKALENTSGPAEEIRRSGARHALTTMSVLRLAFLSSFALEFIATLSVALVAVGIGLRLVHGEISLEAGLIILIVVPEVYAPLRRVGAAFHASADGLTAANQVFQLIKNTPPADATPVKEFSEELCIQGLSVAGRDGILPQNLSFTAPHGQITILLGGNGSGKSTTFLAVLGVLPYSGSITAPPLEAISYLAAQPYCMEGTVDDNLHVFGQRDPATVKALMTELDVQLPPDRHISPGSGISTGQAQRLALTRSLSQPASLYLLDEPSAHLSPELIDPLIQAVQQRAAAGAAIVIATHDERLVKAAHQVIKL